MTALADVLREMGISQTELARRLRVKPATVNRWCNGTRRIKFSVAKHIAAVLGREIEEIQGEIPLLTADERKLLETYRKLDTHARAVVSATMNALVHPTDNDDSPSSDVPAR